jgi:hypothetical protein
MSMDVQTLIFFLSSAVFVPYAISIPLMIVFTTLTEVVLGIYKGKNWNPEYRIKLLIASLSGIAVGVALSSKNVFRDYLTTNSHKSSRTELQTNNRTKILGEIGGAVHDDGQDPSNCSEPE